MKSPKKIIFFYDYFYPGYKAGGPIQSLTNLALALEVDYEIRVVTSTYDLGAAKPYRGININDWNEVRIPGSKAGILVYYAGKEPDKTAYRQIFEWGRPEVVYFNNIYSAHSFRLPLQVLNSISEKPKVVICPRGMLQKGAVNMKPFKKKIYFAYLRYKGLLDEASWHATNQEEAGDIQKYFPTNKGIVIASNIPKPPYSQLCYPIKQPGQLKLVYLSLIAEKKNLLFLLQVVKASEHVVLDIYGPVTDARYWQSCLELIGQMPGKVVYKGDVQPDKVQTVLSQYHALILLTRGENFGHALYESLSVGRPVITSYFTPWNELEKKKAGVNVDIDSIEDCMKKITDVAKMNQEEYDLRCVGAHKLALEYYNNLETVVKYDVLFG